MLSEKGMSQPQHGTSASNSREVLDASLPSLVLPLPTASYLNLGGLNTQTTILQSPKDGVSKELE